MVNQTIDGSFNDLWEVLVEEDPKLSAYPKSYRNMLKRVYTQGFLIGQHERRIEAEAHGETPRDNRKP